MTITLSISYTFLGKYTSSILVTEDYKGGNIVVKRAGVLSWKSVCSENNLFT